MTGTPYKLLLVDEDAAFRLGLQTVLGQFPDLQILAGVEQGAAALEFLQRQAVPSESFWVEGQYPSGGTGVDLVILDLGLGRSSPQVSGPPISGLELCQQLKRQYPTLPILLLSSPPEPVLLSAAALGGVEGYCPKTTPVPALVAAIRQVLGGQSAWTPSGALGELPIAEPPSPRSPLAIWRHNLRRSSLQPIETSLTEVEAQLRHGRLSWLDQQVLAGQRRELHTARRLLSWLLPTLPTSPGLPPALAIAAPTPPRSSREASDSALATATDSPPDWPNVQAIQSALFDGIVAQLQSPLINQTQTPLELDILKEEKKRQLLYSILRKFEAGLEELRCSQVTPEQLREKCPALVRDLWQAAITEFFGKYYTLQVGDRSIEVVPTLLAEAETVWTAILSKIPLVPELLAHLLFQTPLVVDQNSYGAGTLGAMHRAQQLVEHLIIQGGNGVVQPLLNRFAQVEEIKQNFYDRRLLSTREIERFRNDLSWKYRLEKYVGEPKAIFESEYQLWGVGAGGFKKITIYAHRSPELEQLGGIRLAVTLGLELRDAIAPRLQSALSFLGSGFVYLLTEVVGRGIGLVGRGVLKGIGNAFQDQKTKK